MHSTDQSVVVAVHGVDIGGEEESVVPLGDAHNLADGLHHEAYGDVLENLRAKQCDDSIQIRSTVIVRRGNI